MPDDATPVSMMGPDIGVNVGVEGVDPALTDVVPPNVNGFRISDICLTVLNTSGATGTAEFRLYEGSIERADIFKPPRAQPRFTQLFYPQTILFLWPVFWVLLPGHGWEVRILNNTGANRAFLAGLHGWYF